MTNKIEQIIQDVWFGRESLARTFWLYKVVIGGLIGFLFQILFLQDVKTLSIVVLAFYTVYHIWVLKGLIACKNNVKKFHFISQIIIYFVCVNAIMLFINIVDVFLLPISG